MVLHRIRKSKVTKVIVVILTMSICNNFLYFNRLFAVTSGPKAPEFQSFTSIGVTDMVDPFTGNFSYNLPLFEVPGPNGGYPISIAYQSDINMEQEASWVGLGWTLNAGSIQRNVRGVPDDFNGKKIFKTLDMKPSTTIGGSFSPGFEPAGADLKKLGLDVSLSIKLYFNNKTGWGMGTGAGLKWLGKGDNGLKLVPGFSINSDSQNGTSLTPTVSLKSQTEKEVKSLNLGISLSSSTGISYSLGVSYQRSGNEDKVSNALDYNAKNPNAFIQAKVPELVRTLSTGGSSSISFSNPTYIPAIPNEYTGTTFTGAFRIGGAIFGAYLNATTQGFCTIHKLKEKNNNYNSYGYLYLGEGVDDEKRILDYDREKEGMLGVNSPNLGMPNMQYDVYSIQGQGISGMFRPYRTDLGVVSDPIVKYTINSSDIGGEIGIGPLTVTPPTFGVSEWGINGEYSGTINKQDYWVDDFKGSDLFDYKYKKHDDYNSKSQKTPLVYYKIHGEYTSYNESQKNYIGGDLPVYIPITSKHGELGNKFISKTDPNILFVDENSIAEKKFETSTIISSFKNKELKSNSKYSTQYSIENSNHIVSQATLNYDNRVVPSAFSESNSEDGNISNEIGGYSVTKQDGSRYYYMLPVYNLVKEELSFSVNANIDHDKGKVLIPKDGNKIDYKLDDTDEYYNYTKTPAYATSYLLTAVVGADYVDVDGNGPSDNDIGYWVKFNYSKKENYAWRSPFNDATYIRGSESFSEDDKGAFSYGVREQYYLESIETKTHKAIFEISQKNDAIGADKFGGKDNSSYTYKLDKIKLYTKQELARKTVTYSPIPIKTVNLKYNYETCGNVDNNINGGGKLTLEQLYFTYGNSERGAQSPYKFNYGLLPNGDAVIDEDTGLPTQYNPKKMDRWGNYKKTNFKNEDKSTEKNYQEFPYNVQSASQIDDNYENFEKLKKDEATAWQLTDIYLPSGGKIKIEYEQDDYAYVQQQKAQEVFFIDSEKSEILYDNNWNENSKTDNIEKRKVYFKLKNPENVADVTENTFFEKYVAPLKRNNQYQIYFKIKSQLLPGNVYNEFISGYAELELDASKTPICGFDENRITNGKYEYGYVVVQSTQVSKYEKMKCIAKNYYHPFAVAAWQYIRLNAMQLMNSKIDGLDDFENKGKSQKISLMKAACSSMPKLASIFKDYTSIAFNRKYGQKIFTEESFIRLAVPDGKKYGGGTRVSKISITDNWNQISSQSPTQVQNATYGQIYNYTKEEVNTSGVSSIISSGVASYEPMVGGDENALRYAKSYKGSVKFQSDNNLFFEYPINESLYPAPSVGYSKVTVHSFATEAMKSQPEHTGDGYTIYEYYTAQDFPVISYETNTSDKNAQQVYNPIPVLVPLIGITYIDKLTLSQGYATLLNDMHGKMKSVSQFSATYEGEIGELLNKITYNYKADKVTEDGIEYYRLNNIMEANTLITSDMNVAEGNYNVTLNSSRMIMGEEYDFIIETNHRQVISHMEGCDYNTDAIILPFPFPWPSYSYDEDELNTIVTNKIIHRTGILQSITTQEKGAVVQTVTNELFDSKTGNVMLTSSTTGQKELVNGKYENQKLYDYKISAFKQDVYKAMGLASQNQGLLFPVNGAISTVSKEYSFTISNSSLSMSFEELKKCFIVGDEFLVLRNSPGNTNNGTFVTNAYLKHVTPGLTDITITVITENDLNQNSNYFLKNIRSGNRNMMDVNAGNMIFLNNKISSTINEMKNRNFYTEPCTDIININKDVAIILNKIFFTKDLGVNKLDLLSGLSNYYSLYNDLQQFNRNLNYGDLKVMYKLTEKHSGGKKSYPSCHGDTKINDPYNENYILGYDIPRWKAVDISIRVYRKSVTSNCSNDEIELIGSLLLPYFYVRIDSRLQIIDVKFSELPSELTEDDISLPILFKPMNLEYNINVPNNIEYSFWDQNRLSTSDVLDWELLYNTDHSNVNWNFGNYFNKTDIKVVLFPQVLNASSTTYSVDSDNESLAATATNPIDLQKFLLRQVKKSYAYNENRQTSLFQVNQNSLKATYTGIPESLTIPQRAKIISNGVFEPYRYFIWNETPQLRNDISKWIATEEITKYANNGLPCESKNALGIPSCVHFDEYSNQPKIVAQNAKLGEVAYIDFENSQFLNSQRAVYTNLVKHTGNKSAQINIPGPVDNTGFSVTIPLPDAKTGKYSLSFWMKTEKANVNSYITINGHNRYLISGEKSTFGNWKQYVFNDIEIPANFSPQNVILFIGASYPSSSIYIDDIRIQPYNASMQTYVYDPTTFKVTSILDQNGYASFYYYNEEGNLYLVKKETEEGIKTIQENISHQSEINGEQ